jgi:two-component system response regulator NreC
VHPPAQIQREKAAADRKIRCVLALSHVLLREGVRRLLQDEADLEVVGEAGNVSEMLKRVSEHRPQVVIADAEALGLTSRELEGLIGSASPATKLVFLNRDEQRPAQHGETVWVRSEAQTSFPQSRSAQPSGGMQTSAQQLIRMVQSAGNAGRPALYEMPRAGRSSTKVLTRRQQVLTAREREVLKLLAEGKTVRSAAAVLGVSAKTVDAHKFNLMRKVGVHNKVDLVMWAIQAGVVKVPANF